MFKIPLFGLSSVFYTSCTKKEPYLFIGKTHKFKNCLNLMTLDKVHALLGIKKNKDNSRKPKTKVLKNKLNKFKYRTHLIDSFNLRSNSM